MEELIEDEITQAERMSEENRLPVEVNQAYIDLVGEEYADADEVAEAYQGQYRSDVDFAQQTAGDLGLMREKDIQWPYTCIDWDRAARELMYDYSEQDGYYFRNL